MGSPICGVALGCRWLCWMREVQLVQEGEAPRRASPGLRLSWGWEGGVIGSLAAPRGCWPSGFPPCDPSAPSPCLPHTLLPHLSGTSPPGTVPVVPSTQPGTLCSQGAGDRPRVCALDAGQKVTQWVLGLCWRCPRESPLALRGICGLAIGGSVRTKTQCQGPRMLVSVQPVAEVSLGPVEHLLERWGVGIHLGRCESQGTRGRGWGLTATTWWPGLCSRALGSRDRLCLHTCPFCCTCRTLEPGGGAGLVRCLCPSSQVLLWNLRACMRQRVRGRAEGPLWPAVPWDRTPRPDPTPGNFPPHTCTDFGAGYSQAAGPSCVCSTFSSPALC